MTTDKLLFLHGDGEVTKNSYESQSEQIWRFTLHPARCTSDWVLFDNTPFYCELSPEALWEPWNALCDPSIPCGLSALHFSGLAVMDGRVTFNLLGIVDDEIAVPYDGEVHCQVTDLHTLVHVLKSRNREWRSVQKAHKGREKVKERQGIESKKKRRWWERQRGEMRGWKGSRETRLLTICHFCHGCLPLFSDM